MNSRFLFVAAAAALVWSLALWAQTPYAPAAPTAPTAPTAPAGPTAPTAPAAATAPPPSVPMPAVPTHPCSKPQFPGKSAPPAQITAFNNEVVNYNACIRKYVDDTKALATAAQAAGNSAVDEFNKFAAEIRAEVDAK
jgi:hypothetical protein